MRKDSLPTNEPENTPPNGDPEEETQLSSEPQLGTPAPEARLRGSELRYTAEDNVPEWAIGKTADEMLAITQELHQAVINGTPQTPQTPSHTPAASYVPQTPSPSPQINTDLMYSNPEAFVKSIVDATRQATREEIASASPALTTPMASMARAQAQSHRPKVWAKYGPKVDAMMATATPAQKASVQLWQKAVDIVAGEHVDEIARDRAEELMRSGDTGMLGGAGGVPRTTTSSASPIRKLFNDGDPSIQPFLDEGLTAKDVIAHGAKMGHSEEKWAEMLTRKTSRRVRA